MPEKWNSGCVKKDHCATPSIMHPEQKRIFQSMTHGQKLKIALRLYYSARELKEAGLRALNPDWDEGKIEDKVREIFFYART